MFLRGACDPSSVRCPQLRSRPGQTEEAVNTCLIEADDGSAIDLGDGNTHLPCPSDQVARRLGVAGDVDLSKGNPSAAQVDLGSLAPGTGRGGEDQDAVSLGLGRLGHAASSVVW
jgi:hypothetical protein